MIENPQMIQASYSLSLNENGGKSYEGDLAIFKVSDSRPQS